MIKRRFTKVLAIVLALTIMFSAISVSAGAAEASKPYPLEDNALTVILSDILDSILRFIMNFLSSLFPNNPAFIKGEETETVADRVASNFYKGLGYDSENDTYDFQTGAAPEARWNIGYANTSLVPDDVTNGEYFLGGYIGIENGFTNVVEGVIDDMKARCIAINDGTGRGTVLFATIDCIGITNGDIKDIRELLKDFAAENNIVAINVESTHCHSGIDTEGLWTNNIVKILDNGLTAGLNVDAELQQGTNPNYMKFLKKQVANALKEAFADLRPGELTYAIKDVGQDYFNNKNRPTAGVINPETDEIEVAMTDISRFIFTPDDGSKKTMMINMAAHPDVTGLPTSDNSGREVSGDYIYWIGDYVDKYGYNFMFFQGAIAGIYMARGATNDNVEMAERYEQSKRYGYEIARMALSFTLTEDEIKADPELSCSEEVAQYGGTEGYSIWYEGWTPVEEEVVAPYLNLALDQVEVPITNDLIKTAGKLNLAKYIVIAHDDGTYTIYVEIGYIEIGDKFKAVLLPGEICQDLIVGGTSLSAKYAVRAADFEHPTAADLFGEDIKCFGLMNDAIGYVVPDNDFTMGDPANHYHELICLGEFVAPQLMDGLAILAGKLNY